MPGQAGASVSTTGGTGGANARQRIARSDATFTGLGLRYARLDAPANPRRGALLDVLVEAGRRARAFTEAREDGLVRVRTRERQERVEAHARAYVPTFARQAFVVGGDFYALRSPTFDEGDLFRFGGAATLRGYDEERFRARTAARALAEYRYALDAGSYAFAFADAGYVDQPDLRTPDDAANDATRQTLAPERGLFPGYGVGLQLSTAVGLVTATYAASPESGLAQGRVHVGLAFGL